MADQFTEFKKCITWYKSQNAWCGSFSVERAGNFGGKSYSMQASPEQSGKTAKPEIAECLYRRITAVCKEYGFELNDIIKKKLLAKGKRKQ